MPVNIQKVLVCDAVDASCIQLLEKNGIKVIYLFFFSVFRRLVVSNTLSHTRTHRQNFTFSFVGGASFFRISNEKKNIINQPVFETICANSQRKRFLDVKKWGFSFACEHIQQVARQFTRASASALFARAFVHVHRYFFIVSLRLIYSTGKIY